MKAAFLALLLANILFFAWYRWHAPSGLEDTVAPEQQAAALALADESDSERTATEQAQAQSEAARCLSVGPFAGLPEATQAAAALRAKGHEPKTRTAQGDVWAGLWVYLAQLPSRAETQRIMALLKQNGMSDAYIMPSLNQSNEISLGIFSEPPRARRRAEEVRRLGFTPTVVEHTRKGTVYWLDVDLQPAGDAIDPQDLQEPTADGGGRIVRLEIKPCPRQAAG